MLIISEFNPQLMHSDDSEDDYDHQSSHRNSSNGTTTFNQIITYKGQISSLNDALLIIEACRLQKLPMVTRRLTGIERNKFIKPNTVFVWNETQCGMKRWTDGRLWSASKVYNGNFLVYKQLNKKTKREQEEDESGGQALVKQSFSVVTKDHQRFHLISYYENVPGSFRPKSASNQTTTTINIPSHDSKFNQLDLSNAIYPDSLLNSIYKRKHQQQQNKQHPQQQTEQLRQQSYSPAILPNSNNNPVSLESNPGAGISSNLYSLMNQTSTHYTPPSSSLSSSSLSSNSSNSSNSSSGSINSQLTTQSSSPLSIPSLHIKSAGYFTSSGPNNNTFTLQKAGPQNRQQRANHPLTLQPLSKISQLSQTPTPGNNNNTGIINDYDSRTVSALNKTWLK
ncbi:hypothetical protein MGE_04151 [Candida albicans P75010]|nr:hypothetical protein MGE_04151 [Candida albicans P75010]